MKRGTCTGCGQRRAVTVNGLIARHGPNLSCCGVGLVPAEVAVQAVLLVLDDLPVFTLNDAAVVRLDDLNTAAAHTAARLGLEAHDG